MSQLSVSAFDEKASELDKLKRLSILHMRRVNALKIEYMVSVSVSELAGRLAYSADSYNQ